MIDNNLVANKLFELAEAYRLEGSAAPLDEQDMYFGDANDYVTAGVMLRDVTYNLLAQFLYYRDTAVRENIMDYMEDWMDEAEFKVAVKVINKFVEQKVAYITDLVA